MNSKFAIFIARTSLVTLLLSGIGLSVAAQTSGTVTIKFDDGEGITGDLVETTETSVRLDTLMGVVTVPLEGVSCIGVACPEAIRLEVKKAPVILTSLDGSAKLVGDLIDIVENQYVVATNVGEFRIGTDKVTCDGTACPPTASQPSFGGPVVLTDGSTKIEGELTAMEEETYLVDVALIGLLRVSRNFECSGDGCPVQ